MKNWTIFVCLFLFPQNLHAANTADEVNVDAPLRDLASACKKDGKEGDLQTFFDVAFCRGYMAGWMESGKHPELCMANTEARLSDLSRIFAAFVDKNPVWRTRRLSDAVGAAMQDAFPCPSK